MTIGQRIRDARKNAGMTQTELAKKLNVPFQSISQWERDLRNPKFDTIQRLADALEIHPFDLMGIDKEMQGYDISVEFEAETDEPTRQKILELLHKDTRSIYDELTDIQKTEFWGILMKPLHLQLSEAFAKLNENGQEIAVQRVQELCEIPKYLRKQPPHDKK